jgi:hypothetical protein
MNKLLYCGLVIGLLMCGAVLSGVCAAQDATSAGDASAAEEAEVSEDFAQGYYQGFYDAAMAYSNWFYLGASYNSLSGEESPDEEQINLYNENAEMFNQQTVPFVKNVIVQMFGEEDNRTQYLLLPELPLIE